MKIVIRRAKIEDAAAITRLTRETIRKVNIKDYSRNQVDVWSKTNTSRNLKSRIANAMAPKFIALSDRKIVGVVSINLDTCEIGGLYIRHDMHGLGIGSRLLKYVESYAERKGLKFIKLYSTLTAFEFYKHHGYKRIRRMNHMVKGIAIPAIFMKKKL